MMSGLTMLQSLYGLREDQVVDRWPENLYWQHLTEPLAGWRKVNVRPTRKEVDLTEEIKELLDIDSPNAEKVVLVWDNLNKPSSLKRVSVDTTVQPKNIAHPTYSKLLNRSRQRLVKRIQYINRPLHNPNIQPRC